MTIFPGRLDPAYYSDQDWGVIRMMQDSYERASTINLSFWSEADTDYRFYAGDQTLWNDIYGNLPAFRRRQFNFNIIKPTIQMPVGYQRRNRKSMVAIPVENGDAKTADQFTKCLMWSNNNGHVLETISEAFEGALVTGMNLLSPWMDFRSDPVNGNICVDRLNYNEFLIDPFFRKADLSDCNFIWTRKMLQPRQVAALLPEHANEVLNMSSQGNRDGKFQFMPESYNFSMEQLLTYDEYWYRTYRESKVICDLQSGETEEWHGTDEELQQFNAALTRGGFPPVVMGTSMKPTTRLAIVVQGRVMYDGPNPCGIDDWPFVPVFGYYMPSIPYWPQRIQGLVRGMRDAQYLFNRKKLIEFDIMESRANSGWIFEESAPVDPNFAFNQTGQGRAIAMKDGAMDRIREISPPPLDPQWAQQSQSLLDLMPRLAGVTEELMGMASDDSDVGITTLLRQGAGLTTLQTLFDQLDQSQARLGKLMIEMMQANWTPGKVRRIISEEPSDEFYTRSFSMYDCVVADGLNTATQRQMYTRQLLDLKAMGIPVPTSAILDGLDIQNKDKLMQAINQAEQQQQQQARQAAMIGMQREEAQMHALQARAQADQGLGLERLSRVEENVLSGQERVAEAEKNREEALLKLVETLQKLQTTDLSNLAQMLSVAETLKGVVTQDAKEESNESPTMAALKQGTRAPQPTLGG